MCLFAPRGAVSAAVHEAAGVCLACVKAFEKRLEDFVQEQGNGDGDRGHEQQNQNALDIRSVVAACNGLAHCVHGILERHHVIQHLEQFREHLHGIGAAGACDLKDEDDYRKCLACTAECKHEAVVNKRCNEACHSCRQPEEEGIVALNADVEEVAEHRDKRGELSDCEEDEISSEVFLRGAEVRELIAAFYVRAHETDAQQGACPDSKHGVERSHTGAEVVERVDSDDLKV